jgi:hypothetical protein
MSHTHSTRASSITLDAMKRPSWLQRSDATPLEVLMPTGGLQAAAGWVAGAVSCTVSYALRTINDGTTAAERDGLTVEVSCSLSTSEGRGGGGRVHTMQQHNTTSHL